MSFERYKRAALAAQDKVARVSKVQLILAAISRPEGASMEELVRVTGWRRHSIRGAISRDLRKHGGQKITLAAQGTMHRYVLPFPVAKDENPSEAVAARIATK